MMEFPLWSLEKATKYCGEDSQWFRHPETNRMWTNYSLCSVTDQEMLKVESLNLPRPAWSDPEVGKLRLGGQMWSN